MAVKLSKLVNAHVLQQLHRALRVKLFKHSYSYIQMFSQKRTKATADAYTCRLQLWP